MFSTAVGIIQVVLGFSALIFVHELGHFLVAKWVGVRVEVFSIGFGPYLFPYRRGKTLYALSLIPLGGYVKMRGQHDLQMVDDRAPDSYLSKSVPKRMAIISAGVIMNIIFAYLILVLAYSTAGINFQPSVIEPALVNAMVAVVLAIAAAQLDLGLGTGGYVAVAVGFFAAMSAAGMTAAHDRKKRRR